MAVVIVVRLVKPFGFMVSIAFGLAFAYLTNRYWSVAVWAKRIVKAQPPTMRTMITTIDSECAI